MDVLRDAKASPQYREAESEARDRRIANMVWVFYYNKLYGS